MKILCREDFKYTVSLPCPHSGDEVFGWFRDSKIPFMYATHNAGKTIEYLMLEEHHALLFKLRWV